ncbi:MAG: 16S rRNA (adenine(1518)-N(6)/adenine(1519)-N(6))-dimethyltransferase RsmA [Candidatus Competibacteraceae bacterium]|nr:16S rRNA (adenine(1518)-N(6)/adenine(1519)-N(6))-dimethyltransferase RsmA [Candidatus Competibacteraceae bacterium]
MDNAHHRARKRFGQHFLHDTTVVARIVDAVHPRPGEHLVEIGPGLGAMTRQLLPRVGRLEAVELDRDVIPRLQARCRDLGELVVYQQDALDFDFAALVTDDRPLRLVGNLPYNISTPLLFHLLRSASLIQDMHFMLQKEVVERLAADPGGRDYGRLSVMIQFHCRVDTLFPVAPEAFSPAPKVDSKVVRLIPRPQPPVAVAPERLARLVRQAFAQRRKTLRNNLRGLLEVGEIQAAGIDPGVRPETLSLEQFAALANRL